MLNEIKAMVHKQHDYLKITVSCQVTSARNTSAESNSEKQKDKQSNKSDDLTSLKSVEGRRRKKEEMIETLSS